MDSTHRDPAASDWEVELALREFLAAIVKARRAAARYSEGDALRRRSRAEVHAAARRLARRGSLQIEVSPQGLTWCGQTVWRDTEEAQLAGELIHAGIESFAVAPELDAAIRALLRTSS